VGDSAFNNSKFHDRPVKGFIQVGKIIVFLVAAIVIISILTNKSPLYLIGGLGAFAAVLMLIAKDSIMGFVGGFLLLENDMVRLGDWIEIPGTNINGNVIDISLTIVKVRNWDNTIATIPPYTLINQSFTNWRGMSESGGRRIARGYTIKLDTIKPCSQALLQRISLLDEELADYISRKREQTLNGRTANTSNPDSLANGTIDTNAGLFRAYADIYLHRHPMIHSDMTIMVRTLEPNGNGLPIQFYCFTTTTEWIAYESIQSEIMEHFASMMPLFELYPFQTAGARDTVISGLLEGQYPIERIDGMPYKTIK
jgi:miniconductance mechanosensitive channel